MIRKNKNHKAKKLRLAWLSYADLHNREGLLRLDQLFMEHCARQRTGVEQRLLAFQSSPDRLDQQRYSELIIEVSPHIETFLLHLFQLDTQVLSDKYQDGNLRLILKNKFVEVAYKKFFKPDLDMSFSSVHSWLASQVPLHESDVARFAISILNDQDDVAYKRLLLWCYYVSRDPTLFPEAKAWYAFWRPEKNIMEAVGVRSHGVDYCYVSDNEIENGRDNFDCVADYKSSEEVHTQNHYCLTCHDKQVDYCRSGFYQVKRDPDQGFRRDTSDMLMSGCPLDEKISEMHWLKQRGFHVAALVAVMIDNPMCAVTGHRICYDCMRSCIYQKQEPVDTPQVETRVLQDVLELPWGVEIYDLLVRWHPLRCDERLPKPDNGKKVAVMGLGPAGFSLVHHLSMQGCAVVGFDGALIKSWPYGDVMQPIYDFESIREPLSQRSVLGFGGVAEYGITSRWDKNLLKLVYLSLLRRDRVRIYGSVRFGGTLTLEDCWKWGFDHVALALGAGLPQALRIPHSLAKGMMQANDFLMSLQLTGSHQAESIQSLLPQLPCVVIGAGLTAVDTATEVQAYYLQIVQVIAKRSKILRDKLGEQPFWAAFSEKESAALQVVIEHGELVLAERLSANKQHRKPNFTDLLSRWGGVAIVYRRGLKDSPAYRQNPHELQACLDQGVCLYERTTPVAVDVDEEGYVCHLQCLQPWQPEADAASLKMQGMVWHADRGVWSLSESTIFSVGMVLGVSYPRLEKHGNFPQYWAIVAQNQQAGTIEVKPYPSDTFNPRIFYQLGVDNILIEAIFRPLLLPAKSVLVATGALPNVAYGYEHRHALVRDGAFYATHALGANGTLSRVSVVDRGQDKVDGFFTNYDDEGRKVSFCGDLHPKYHGSVVKAVASAQYVTPHIVRSLGFVASCSAKHAASFLYELEQHVSCVCVVNECWHDEMVHLVLRCPFVVRKSLAGHLFKLRRLKDGSSSDGLVPIQSVVLQACDIDYDRGHLHFVFKKEGVEKSWLAKCVPGEKLSCMGPTGVRMSLPKSRSTILIMTDAVQFPVALFYARTLYAKGHTVRMVIFGVVSAVRSYYASWLSGLDCVWLADESLLHDDVIIDYYKRCDRVYLQGKALFVTSTYRALLAKNGANVPVMIGSVIGPMQCMLKGICAQCLQWQIDPDTGARTKAVYTCSWQDQPLEIVDLNHLLDRNEPGVFQSKLNRLWYTHLCVD